MNRGLVGVTRLPDRAGLGSVQALSKLRMCSCVGGEKRF